MALGTVLGCSMNEVMPPATAALDSEAMSPLWVSPVRESALGRRWLRNQVIAFGIDDLGSRRFGADAWGNFGNPLVLNQNIAFKNSPFVDNFCVLYQILFMVLVYNRLKIWRILKVITPKTAPMIELLILDLAFGTVGKDDGHFNDPEFIVERPVFHLDLNA
jgi:hypothetical protein